jgi:hypothetical protein
MSQLKVNALVSYSGNTVTLGTSGDTINVASGVTFNTASATVNLPTTIKVDTIQNTNSTNLITQTNVTTITFGATSQTISVPSVASFATTIGVGGATPAASGAGITFPASASASTNANTLDDYEEGTWTPEYAPISGAAFTSITYGFREAAYTKIGRQVICNCNMRTSALTKGSASGDIQITGLPFTIASGANTDVYAPVGIGISWLSNQPSNIRTTNGTTNAIIQKGFSNSGVTVADMSTGGANNFIAVTFTYFT